MELLEAGKGRPTVSHSLEVDHPQPLVGAVGGTSAVLALGEWTGLDGRWGSPPLSLGFREGLELKSNALSPSPPPPNVYGFMHA